LSKSNGNKDRKAVKKFLWEHSEINGFYRREELKASLLVILCAFRKKCEELSKNGGTDEALNEFIPVVHSLANDFFGEENKREPNIRRALVKGFLYQVMQTIEGSYRENVHQ